MTGSGGRLIDKRVEGLVGGIWSEDDGRLTGRRWECSGERLSSGFGGIGGAGARRFCIGSCAVDGGSSLTLRSYGLWS